MSDATSQDPNHENRRRHKRVEAAMPCVLVGDDGGEESFDLVDLSESGVRMRCGHAMSAMTRIHVAMVLPGDRVGRDEDVRLDTAGVVVWSHPLADEQFDTGVFFPELDDQKRGMLQAYVLSAAEQ